MSKQKSKQTSLRQSQPAPEYPVFEIASLLPITAKHLPRQLVVHLGELAQPITSWADLTKSLNASLVSRVESALGHGDTFHIVARYRRADHSGTLALVVTPGAPPRLSAMQSASRDLGVRALRAGVDSGALSQRAVTIVGVGAIGSFVADLLVRSGIGLLSLVDGEILRPGNVVRHLAGLGLVGLPKVEAVRRELLSLGLLSGDRLIVSSKGLTSFEAAADLFQNQHLVIDATASGPVLAMLELASQASGAALITTGLHRDGDLVRVDRFPILDGEEHSPAIPMSPTADRQVLESGCGDPVSLTPPHSVVAAAALTTKIAVRGLLGRTVPPTTIEVLNPQADAPYNTEGLVS